MCRKVSDNIFDMLKNILLYVNTIRSHLGCTPYLDNAHFGAALQQLVHDPPMRRVQVLDDDKGDPALLGHVPQKLFQRL